MISHSQALLAWNSILSHGEFPFKEVIQSGVRYKDILDIHTYFRNLEKEKKVDNFTYVNSKSKFKKIYETIPNEKNNNKIKIVAEYFTQLEK